MTILTDTIGEYTAAAGVAIDGLTIKDGGIVTLLNLSKLGTNTFYVDPKGGGAYTTLSAALTAVGSLLTPATDNEVLIVVTGEVAETAAITPLDHVHVLFLAGASVTVTSNSTLNAVNFASLTNCTWAAIDKDKPTIIRAGAVGAGSHGIYITGGGAGLRLENLYVSNVTTGFAGCYGIHIRTGAVPTMINCTGVGGAGGATCHGIYSISTSATMTNCTGIGGAGGTTCHGINNYSASNPTMINCTGTGGAGGATCHGIHNDASNPTMTNCTGVGGAGGTTCYGINNYLASNPTMNGCTGTGGAGGATCHGIYNDTVSSPRMTNCAGIGGGGGAASSGIYNRNANPTMTNCAGIGGSGGLNCYGIYNDGTANPTMTNCTGTGGGAQRMNATAAVTASSRQEDAFQPTASHPYRVVGLILSVTAAAAGGVTLTLRDTTGGAGNALCAATAVSTTGLKYIDITGHRIITAGSNVFGWLSASDATLAYTWYLIYETAYAIGYALYHSTTAPVAVQDCTFVSNAASAAVYVTTSGDDASKFIGGSARSGLNDAGRSKAFVAAASWSPGQVYNMVLDGGSTNLTAAAGTANGSNIEL